MYPGLHYDFDYASRTNGKKPAEEFYYDLPVEERDTFKVLADKLGKEGKLAKNRFKKLSGCDIWQLSTYDHRILCFLSGRCFLFTNGFPKTGADTPPRHIELAKKIRKEHFAKMRQMKGA